MASDADVYQVRLFVAEPDDKLPWTDAEIGKAIDGAEGDLNLAAHNIWAAKAASAADLVNISEGGSSRSMGDLHKQAMEMSKFYGSKVSGGVEAEPRSTRRHKLTR